MFHSTTTILPSAFPDRLGPFPDRTLLFGDLEDNWRAWWCIHIQNPAGGLGTLITNFKLGVMSRGP